MAARCATSVALELAIGRVDEVRGEARDLAPRNRAGAVLELLPLGLDLPRELGGRELLHQDLDPRFPQVVAAPVTVVDAQDRVEVVEELGRRQKLADHVADHRRAALAAADDDAEAGATGLVAHCLHADVVDEDRRAIVASRR